MPNSLISTIDSFLRQANQNTYANEGAQRVESLHPGSRDYHFQKGNLEFHDTFFGATRFIGEEVIYQDKKAVWGMNYYGFTVSDDINEKLFDSILRPALMSGSGDNIPVRGPKEFINGKWKYTFKVTGDLVNFTGTEEISKNGEVVCRLYCHGGFIE